MLAGDGSVVVVDVDVDDSVAVEIVVVVVDDSVVVVVVDTAAAVVVAVDETELGHPDTVVEGPDTEKSSFSDEGNYVGTG